MDFTNHFDLKGKHALFPASKPSWLRYDKKKLQDTYHNMQAAERGTLLHEHAANCISFGTRLARYKNTLNMYVNDSIGFSMKPEVVLKYSDNFFGTADGIVFDEKEKILRINDFKSGVTPAHMEQLEVYAALFCLEYCIRPGDILIELRIYQSNEIIFFNPTAEDIAPIMDTIQTFDRWINKWKEEGE